MATNEVTTRARESSTSIWPVLTVLGIAIYVVVDIILVSLRPDYSWLHNAESDYGRGPYFWLMDINFIVRCLVALTLAKAIATRFPLNKLTRQASRWLVVWGAASGLLAFFADNPYGYPKLRSGAVHLLIAFIAFLAAAIALLVLNRLASVMELRRSNTRILVGFSGIAIVSLVLLAHAGFQPHSIGGLYERVFLASVLAWQAALALFIRSK